MILIWLIVDLLLAGILAAIAETWNAPVAAADIADRIGVDVVLTAGIWAGSPRAPQAVARRSRDEVDAKLWYPLSSRGGWS